MKLLIGIAAAAVIAVATPTLANAVEFDAPGVHVDVGEGHHHDGRRDRRHRNHGWRHAYGRECETITVRKRVRGNLVIRHIQKCGRHRNLP